MWMTAEQEESMAHADRQSSRVALLEEKRKLAVGDDVDTTKSKLTFASASKTAAKASA